MRILCALALLGSLLTAQADARIAKTLATWAHAYDQQKIPLEEFFDRDHRKAWGSALGRGGILERYTSKEYQHSHHWVIERLLQRGERESSPLTVRGALEIASAGFAYPLFDHDSEQLRELGTWSIMRSKGDHVWATVARVARGELGTLRPYSKHMHAIALQCAAIRVLGIHGDELARETAEKSLASAESQVRLAATEALDRIRSVKSIGSLYRALQKESHPLVSQALIDAQKSIFSQRGKELSQAQVDAAIVASFAKLHRLGWRCDMSIIALAEALPSRLSIPHLITALDPKALSRARLHRGEGAGSKVCRHRAWRILRRLTGALIDEDDVDGWRAFYQKEGSKLKLVSREQWSNKAVKTSSGFYGIPVVGRETVFVIDTSKSMRDRVRESDDKSRRVRRIDLARTQLLEALQGMPPKWRFRLVTFSSEVHEWNQRAARPSKRTRKEIARVLEMLQPSGRTKLAEALAKVLRVSELRFGVAVKNPIDEIFVLSDGLPSDIDDPEEFLAWLRKVNQFQNVRINTVFSGDGPGLDLMREIAAQHGGDFVQW